MPTLQILIFKLLLILACLADTHSYTPPAPINLTTLQYRISELSSLEINGQTNINKFCCSYLDAYDKKSLTYKYDQDYTDIFFEEAKLTMQTHKLDCGKKLINKDMMKTLQADQYPHITLQLKEVKNNRGGDLSKCNEWFELMAVADITITCHTNTYEFPIRLKKLDLHTLRVSGTTSLQLCDYEIDAPTAMLGLIKVKDKLDINFDLHIEVI
ncbi:MAG: hypothetical protein HKN09_02870 [Saprospiraceae bacterium]|nr:hypothetical protein [Saprospiraceae bacterium]